MVFDSRGMERKPAVSDGMGPAMTFLGIPTVALAAFVIREAGRKSRYAVLFCLSWFAITLAPMLPLPEHHSDYYLTVPAIGLAMLCGLGVYRGRLRAVSVWRLAVSQTGFRHHAGAGALLRSVLIRACRLPESNDSDRPDRHPMVALNPEPGRSRGWFSWGDGSRASPSGKNHRSGWNSDRSLRQFDRRIRHLFGGPE